MSVLSKVGRDKRETRVIGATPTRGYVHVGRHDGRAETHLCKKQHTRYNNRLSVNNPNLSQQQTSSDDNETTGNSDNIRKET